LESGCDLATLQTLLGHANIRDTTIYLHLSQRHLRSAGNPLDAIEVSSPDQIKRSRKLHKK
jgi:integrase/recombinase XerD